MASLAPIHQRFLWRLQALEDIFTNWIVNASAHSADPDIMFLEGLISALWQHWSLFCRRVVFSSAMGCVTRTGHVVPACVSPVTWERVSYLAWRAHSGGSVQAGLVNTDLKREPTWGDVQKTQQVVAALATANASHLISCLGSVSRGPIDVHLVRNATSHRNTQTFAGVKTLHLYYNASRIRHPAEVVTWVEPASHDFAFVAWVDEMRLLADLLTN